MFWSWICGVDCYKSPPGSLRGCVLICCAWPVSLIDKKCVAGDELSYCRALMWQWRPLFLHSVRQLARILCCGCEVCMCHICACLHLLLCRFVRRPFVLLISMRVSDNICTCNALCVLHEKHTEHVCGLVRSVFAVVCAAYVFPHWAVTEGRLIPLHPGTRSRTRRICSWLWTSCWEETSATTCSRTSSSARTQLDSTSVRWRWRWTTCRASTSSIGISFHFISRPPAAFKLLKSLWL